MAGAQERLTTTYRKLLEQHADEQLGPQRDGPWHYSGQRLREVRSAIEALCRRIAGDWTYSGQRPALGHAGYQFASVNDALAQVLVVAQDGYAQRSPMEPGKLARQAAFGSGGATVEPGSLSKGHREVERLHEAVCAVRDSYDRPWVLDHRTCDELSEGQCRAAMMYRYVYGDGHTAAETAAAIADWLEIPITPHQAAMVSRHGRDRVYHYLRARDLLPEHRSAMDPNRLQGWQAVADYIGVHETTARRYAQWGDPLPVSTLGPNGRIVAFCDELDRWLRRNLRARTST